MLVGGLALLFGVERLVSESGAVTNLFGNIFATVMLHTVLGVSTK